MQSPIKVAMEQCGTVGVNRTLQLYEIPSLLITSGSSRVSTASFFSPRHFYAHCHLPDPPLGIINLYELLCHDI